MIGKQEKKIHGGLSLTAEERETLISFSDTDGNKVFIYSSQQPMIRRLMKNPFFEVLNKSYNRLYSCFPEPICIEGYLPKKALTIRMKIRKLTSQQRKKATASLKYARDARKH